MLQHRNEGINIVGRLNEQSGTSIAAHAVVRALQKRNIPLAYHQLPLQPAARHGEPVDIAQKIQGFDSMPYRATLLLDVPFIVDDMYRHIGHIMENFHVGTVLYWELDDLPAIWRRTYATIDVPFAPSTFVKNALIKAMGVTPPMIPIVPIDLEHAPRAPLKGRPFTFFTNFDVLSSIERKNTQAAIAAFTTAFGKRNDVRFVIKVWEGKGGSVDRSIPAAIEREFPSIQHIFGDFTYSQTRSLIASSDAYVSLHRSEGLGLGMLEAMASGVPVIATDYGGNTDYLDERCGFPVPFSRVSAEGIDTIYNSAHVGTATSWADPNIAYAANAMEQLVADHAGYERLAKAARQRYVDRSRAFASLEWLDPLFPARQIHVVKHETEGAWIRVR